MVFIQKCDTYDEDTVYERVKCIFETHGGIEKYARPGLNVVIKPNLVSKNKPEAAATVHPSIIKAVAKLCLSRGASVTIAESPGGLYDKNSLTGVYNACGVSKALEGSKAALNFDLSETEVENPQAMYLKKLKILTPVAKADVVINLAKFKTHGMMTYTGAVKNMFGVIAGLEKAEYHFKMSDYDEFANCIIDICLAAKPTFSIIDAVTGMEKDGPTAGEPKHIGLLISSENPFEADIAAVGIIDLKSERVPVLKNAIARGLSCSHYSQLSIEGEKIDDVQIRDFIVKYNDDYKRLHFVEGFIGETLSKIVRPKPVFDKKKCKSCGECAKCCPAKVIHVKKGCCATVDLQKCIRCYCCQELCPFKAVSIKKPLINRLLINRR